MINAASHPKWGWTGGGLNANLLRIRGAVPAFGGAVRLPC